MRLFIPFKTLPASQEALSACFLLPRRRHLSHLANQRSKAPPLLDGRGRIPPVLEGVLIALRSARGRPAVHPATSVRHGWRLAGLAAAGLGTASGRLPHV